MVEHEKQPVESEFSEPLEFHPLDAVGEERASRSSPAGDWEGYSLEILSLWFDP